jgi:cytochrome c-type biogenesis protein CcmH/NrfG
MTEAAHVISDDSFDPDFSDDEFPTNRLQTAGLRVVGPIDSTRQEPEQIDWLAKLTTGTDITQALADDPPPPEPTPAGMRQHIAPPRIAPTLGARLTSGLRRGVLLTCLLGLATVVIAGGAYVVASTGWLSNLVSPQSQSSAPTSSSDGNAPLATSNPQSPQSSTDSQAPDSQVSIGGSDATKVRDEGTKQYKAGNFDLAIASLERSVSINGNDAVAYYQLGLAYMAVTGREHSLEDAELAFRTAQSLQPEWAAPYRMLAESLLRRGFYEAAISPALQATRLDPSAAEAWMTLGRAYQGAGKQAEATQAFAQAARLSPPPPPKP